ncbi:MULTISPECIES: FixH family protein [unclassified Thioalkalivibrio]|uniref:FixH family protein n=1 Tax=unclassified Thioalkalivibrio TaxID=2621013 RepID=UPI00036B7C07|nr:MULTISPECIES: FixH family protein [unclassified Thioalkalivibrio]
MSNLVITLGIGSAALAILFALIYRFTRLKAYSTAAVVVAIMLFLFIPYSILTWQGADVFAIHLALYIIVPYGLGIVFTQKEAEAENGGKAKMGRLHWAPLVLVGFFTIVASVQAVLITLAHNGMPQQFIGSILPEPENRAEQVTSAFPGTVAGMESRKQALAVHRVSELQAQREKGWQVRQGWVERPTEGETATLQVEVRDADGAPIDDASIRGLFMWLADERRDQGFEMQHMGDGLYQVEVALPAPGRWDLRFQIQRDGQLLEQQARTRVRSAQSG